MSKFKLATELERRLAIKLLESKGIPLKNITFTGEFVRHDGEYVTDDGSVIMFETKVRNIPSTRYPTTIIERYKYEYLLKQKFDVLIFVFFTDGKVFVENVKTANVREMTRLSPRQTSGRNDMIMKDFIEFDLSKGLLIDYE